MEKEARSEDTPKDEAMKAKIEAPSGDTEKKDTKKSKKSATAKPEESIEAPKLKPDAKPSIFKALGLDKIFESKEYAEPSEDITIVESYLEANTPEAAEELSSSGPGTEDEVLAAASLAYLEALGAIADTQEDFSEDTLDRAADEALLALGITEPTQEAEQEKPEQTLQRPVSAVPKPPESPKTSAVTEANHHHVKNKAFSKRRVKAAKPTSKGSSTPATPALKGSSKPVNPAGRFEKPQPSEPTKEKVTIIHTAIVKKEILVREIAVTKFREITGKKLEEAERFKPEPSTELSPPMVEQSDAVLEKMTSPKQIDSMKLALVLQIASEIKLDGVSLRTMYEKGSVDQKNLRLILKQYLRGKRLDVIWPKPLGEQAVSQEHGDRPVAEMASTTPVIRTGQYRPISNNVKTPTLQTDYHLPPDAIVDNKIQEILSADNSKPAPSYVPLIILAILVVLIIAAILT